MHMNGITVADSPTPATVDVASVEPAGPFLVVGTPFGTWHGAATALLDVLVPGEAQHWAGYGEWHDRVIGDPLLPIIGARAWRIDTSRLVGTADERLLDELPVDARFLTACDARGVWTLDAVTAAFPHAQILGFVESPVSSLASLIDAHDGVDVGALLREWCDAARRLLDHAHDASGRCVLVDVDECRRNPAGLARLATRVSGLAFDSSALRIASGPTNTLNLAVARGLIDDDGDTAVLFARLRASCLWLSGDEPGPSAVRLTLAPPMEHRAILKTYRETAALAASVSGLRADIDERNAALAAGEAAAHGLRTELGVERERLAARVQQINELARELGDLRQSRERLIAEHAKAIEHSLAEGARLSAEIQGLALARGELSDAVHTRSLEVEGLAARLRDADEAIARLSAERDAIAARFDEAAQAARLSADAGKSEIERLSTALDAAEVLARRLTSERDEARADLAAAAEASRLAADASRAEIERLSAALDVAEALSRRLTTERDEARANLAAAAEASRLAADAARAEIAHLSTARDAADSDIQRLTGERDALRNKLADAAEAARLAADVGRAEIERLSAALDLADADLRRLSTEHDGARSDLAEATEHARQALEAGRVAASERDQALRELERLTAESERAAELAARLSAEVDGARAAGEQQALHVRQLTEWAERLEEELEQGRVALASAGDESRRLQAVWTQRLQDVQTERDEWSVRATRSAEELAALQGDLTALEGSLTAKATALAAALAAAETVSEQRQVDLAAGNARVAECVQQIDALSRALAESRAEQERTGTQAQQMQEELEYYHAEILRLKSIPPPPPPPTVGAGLACVARIDLGAIRDTPPHRELSFVARSLEAGQRRAGFVDARLVEHQGRPGLVVFADGGTSVISGWAESGSEQGRGFMLIIPTDRNTVAPLEHFDSSDWLLLLQLIDSLSAALAERQLPAFWRSTAARLRQQVLELPPLLRFDAFDIAALTDTSGGRAAELVLRNVTWHERLIPSVGLRWWLAASAQDDRLELFRPADARQVPWSSWPIDDDGGLAESWPLPLGRGGDVVKKRECWNAMTASDRQFLLGLLGALVHLGARPGWTEALAREGLSVLSERLSAPLAGSHETLTSSRLRRAARVMLGRDVVR